MSTEVLTGFFAQAANFTLYQNNTNQNARLIFNYLSLEGTGTTEVRINTPGKSFVDPKFDDTGNITSTLPPVSYVQLPNIPDTDQDYIEGIIGKQLTSSGLNYGWYWRRWWGFSRFWDNGSSNPNGYMFLTSKVSAKGSRYNYFNYDYNWWRKYDRTMEIPFPVEIFLAPNQSVEFIARQTSSIEIRKGKTVPPVPQQITYNVLVMPEGPC
jgi:hypothetical protein